MGFQISLNLSVKSALKIPLGLDREGAVRAHDARDKIEPETWKRGVRKRSPVPQRICSAFGWWSTTHVKYIVAQRPIDPVWSSHSVICVLCSNTAVPPDSISRHPLAGVGILDAISGRLIYPAIGRCVYKKRRGARLESQWIWLISKEFEMPSFIAEELEGVTANCPESLEGRLLFAVPKSESTVNTRDIPD